ncbi:nucleotidyl transferase AbiEii/AbiGii toxin family protein [Streptomyces sp. GMY02]|uniref:nucleotidyl transferase AbiEii/AbiGii toxin family protein n=1 Tax=Streptomyces sp. GMY02 TaxID=1333528 RepID=UPI002D7FA4CB|nr:nucleotidyl transferase AbiEii/AbiGii toxin family protein [Streptomyces sp. GMY02]
MTPQTPPRAPRATVPADPRAARRAVLDHVLALVADAPWSGGLVLRGSMVLAAWAPGAAREPADLDWIVLDGAVGVDPLDPYPYVDRLATVQQWPEAAGGAARYEIWGEEEFGTGGCRPLLPPEGLRWVYDEDGAGFETAAPPYQDLLDRVARWPQAAPGVRLAADAARTDGTWTYGHYDMPGVRLVIPWHAEGLPPGEVQLDFARDECLPESPVWTLVPRGGGGPPTAVRTASRELSLAWKLLWLHTDSRGDGGARGKDLYDAVVLAELDGVDLSPRLLRKVLRGTPDSFSLAESAGWDVDWAEFRNRNPWVTGTARHWLDRLVRALGPVLGEGLR